MDIIFSNINQRDSNGKRHGYWEYMDIIFSNINQRDSNGKRHGYWEYIWASYLRKGNYINGKKYGYWAHYRYNIITSQKYYL